MLAEKLELLDRGPEFGSEAVGFVCNSVNVVGKRLEFESDGVEAVCSPTNRLLVEEKLEPEDNGTGVG